MTWSSWINPTVITVPGGTSVPSAILCVVEITPESVRSVPDIFMLSFAESALLFASNTERPVSLGTLTVVDLLSESVYKIMVPPFGICPEGSGS